MCVRVCVTKTFIYVIPPSSIKTKLLFTKDFNNLSIIHDPEVCVKF